MDNVVQRSSGCARARPAREARSDVPSGFWQIAFELLVWDDAARVQLFAHAVLLAENSYRVVDVDVPIATQSSGHESAVDTQGRIEHSYRRYVTDHEASR